MSAPIDFDAVLGADYAALLRAEFSKPDPLGNAAYLTGALKNATGELCARVYGDQALPRAHAILILYEDCRR